MTSRSESTVYRRVATTAFQNECLFVRLPGGDTVLRLDGSARDIWDAIEYPVSVERICSKLAGEYECAVEELHAEVERFLADLERRRLVEACSETPSSEEENRSRYLWLLKRSLVNLLYPEHELRIEAAPELSEPMDRLERIRFMRDIRYRMPERFESLIATKQDGHPSSHAYLFPHTLIGLQRLENLERCAEQVFADGVPGDFIEAGVCQGGAAIFLRALQIEYGEDVRRTWVADSFQGMPPATSEVDLLHGADFPESKCPILSFSLEGVRDHFLRYDLLDEGVAFLPGWFSDTLATAPIARLAILRIDADLYQSTKEALESLYDKVSTGGFVIIDDYGSFPGCRQAVDEFRRQNGVHEPLHRIDWEGVYWRKA